MRTEASTDFAKRMRFVLTPTQLKGLKEHKYSSQGISLLEYYALNSFWSWLVEFVPRWVAPNLITFVGFSASLVTTLAIILQDPNAEGKAPQWMFWACALGMLFYQTLDGMDGKQARRIGLSTPLGEFFDHGLDAIATFLYACVSMCTVGINKDYCLLGLTVGMTLLQLNFTYHWQTYVSGVLHFKTIDVCEAHYGQILTLVLSGLWGTGFWDQLFPVLGVSMKLLAISIAFVLSLANLLSAFSIVLTGGVGKNGSTVAGTSVLSPLLSPLAIVAPLAYYLLYSPSQLAHTHFLLFFTAFGLPVTKTVILMMLAGMTKTPYPLLDPVMAGPLLLCLNIHFQLLPDLLLLSLVAMYVVFDVVQICVASIRQICDYLDVPCFTVPTLPKDTETDRE